MKLGALGAVLVRADGTTAHADAVPVDVVDTTGAGDAFAAGFLPAWLSGAEPRAALEAGTGRPCAWSSRIGARP